MKKIKLFSLLNSILLLFDLILFIVFLILGKGNLNSWAIFGFLAMQLFFGWWYLLFSLLIIFHSKSVSKLSNRFLAVFLPFVFIYLTWKNKIKIKEYQLNKTENIFIWIMVIVFFLIGATISIISFVVDKGITEKNFLFSSLFIIPIILSIFVQIFFEKKQKTKFI